MNRGQITTRVIKHIERPNDAEASVLVDDWVREVIKTIEDTYPFPYLKKSQEAPLTADQGIYTLPTDLILHHPYLFRVENISDASKFTPLVQIGEETYNLSYLDNDVSAAKPNYWYLKGGANALEFQVVKNPDTAQQLHLVGGYFYTDLSTWDAAGDAGGTASNYLTDKYPDLVIAGVLAKAYMFYDQNQKADRWFGVYQQELNGDPTKGIPGIIGSNKKMVYGKRRLRVRLAYDEPYAITRRNAGY